jgi:hypothetical protein
MNDAVIANGAAKSLWKGGGTTYVHRRFDRRPVARPGIGPASTPTSTVPIESR